MTIGSQAFTFSVNVLQEYVIPRMQRKLKKYPDPSPALRKQLVDLGFIPDRFYLGAMVFDPTRMEIILRDGSDPFFPLRARLKLLAPGLTPRGVLDEFADSPNHQSQFDCAPCKV